MRAFLTVNAHKIKNQQTIKVYTDGSCIRNINNKHHGGYGVYFGKENKKNVSEPYIDKDVTNNRAELHAIQDAIRLLNTEILENKEIEIYTDSKYVKLGITEWIHKWKQNNWQTSKKEPVKNKDLWIQLFDLTSSFKINWIWVKAHAGNALNEEVDLLAKKAAESN